MKTTMPKPLYCAIYTRKSTEHNLDLAFNSLDAQREACEAYVKSQAHEGWRLLPEHYDDGGLSGASLERPALQLLLTQVKQGRVDVIVVYKVDRLTRSLADFAKLVEAFDANEVAKARAWMSDLAEGRAASFEEIARRENKVERHIRYLAPLAFVSPRIVEVIANGDVPDDLTVSTLARTLPHSWAEQERKLGIA
jgi:Resolvase, N terminal domain